MSKIAKIEITDFRIYSDTQTFSFENNGKIANLIVIYAPNGYGKTSFFDAVEWTYSDKIARFERDKIKDEINRKEFAKGDQILLTNRNSYKEGKEGAVKITVDDGRTVSRRVDSRKIHKQERYHDYRAGIFESGNFLEDDLKSLPQTNLLTQDQIDAFLRYTTPEEKFNALSKFWMEGEDALKIIKKLNGYIRVVDNGRNGIVARRDSLQSEIGKLLNTDQNVLRLNNTIREVSESAVLGFKADQIGNSVNEAVYTSLKELVLSCVKKGERLRENILIKRSQILEILGRLEEYSASIKSFSEVEDQLRTADTLQIMFVEYTAVLSERSIIREAIRENQSLVQDLNTLLASWPFFKEQLEQIITIKLDQHALLLENELQISLASVFETSLKNLEHQQYRWLTEINSLQKSADDVNDSYLQYQYWNGQLSSHQKLLEPYTEAYNEISFQVEELNRRKLYLEGILQNKNLLSLVDDDKLLLNEKLQELNRLEESRQILNNRLDDALEKFNKSGTLNEDLDRILNWGENYVSSTKTSACPLCKTEFENLSELLGRIRLDKFDVLSIQKQQDDISILRKQLEEADATYSAALEAVLLVLRIWVVSCGEMLAQSQIEKEKANQNLVELTGNIQHAREQLGVFVAKITALVPNLGNLEKSGVDDLKLELESKVRDLKQKEQRLKELISKKRSLWDAADNRLTTNKNRKAALENKLLLISSDIRFIECRSLADKLGINETDDTDLLQNRISSVQTLLKSEGSKLHQGAEAVNDWQKRIADFPLQVSEAELPAYKLQLENQLQRLNEPISYFRQLYLSTFESLDVDPDQVRHGQEEIEKKLQVVLSDLELLDNLLVQVEMITENLKKSEYETEINSINLRLKDLEIARSKLGEAHETAAEYINREISNYFKKDVINQIYSRIEPHPDLNMIEFFPDVSGKNLMLDVRAIGNKDVVNPVLYLSAGQLNILSLSIFLATVLESGNKLISTIFMDDPVQNLSDINILSFIDLIRSMIVAHDKQIVISTHDEHFYKLIRNKIPSDVFDAKYIELSEFGKIKDEALLN